MIPKTNSVRDLGIIISSDLKWKQHVSHITMKANSLINLILRTFSCKTLKLYKSLFKTYIRPTLEYNVSAWTSHTISDIRTIESVQKKFTKCVCKRLNIKFNSYIDRLKIWEIETLEYRRLKMDLILLFKILNGFIDIKSEDHFKLPEFYQTYNLRRHDNCLKSHTISKSNIRNNFFSIRILKVWNRLPINIVQSKSSEIFKLRLEKIDLHKYHKFVVQ